jgi:hypothetical protein
MGKVNFLNIVASLAIIISVGGLISTYGSLVDLVQRDSITGHATSSGYVNVTVSTSVSVNLTSDNVFWGSGMVDAGESNATIDTKGNVTRGNWTALTEGLVIKNEGNVVTTLDILSNKNATQFLSGTNPSYQFMVTNVDDDACTVASGFVLGTYYDINSTAKDICSSFAINESVNVDFKLVIPSNSNAGILSSTITVGFEDATP